MVNLKHLDTKSLEERAKVIRRHIIRMLTKAGSGHPGSSLSTVDLLVALFYNKLRHNPQFPKWPERDRFILSKGHACPSLYAILAETGYFDTAKLDTLRQFGSTLQGHPCMKTTPGIEVSGGSLGQGLSVGLGIALAANLDKKDYRTYVMLGDGEIEEGQVWEAAMAASHYKVDNLCAVLDQNGLQIDGFIHEIMSSYPIPDKWRGFGWHVIEIDGHNYESILAAYDEAEKIKGRPTVIVAKTVKGKGVSFMENQVDWHGKAPSKEEAERALAELK
ncbi:MAG: transketolase [Candidatus Brocadia sp. AMX2]|uniref:Transketolase n=1 Tax=Candidatus Brocadia sinica JPN1 TaxID=1197129 RepID=A0ABQ0K2A0_9BACT|nr:MULTISPECIES: transketolase [Brocadia]MBC6931596.1 transketolase [Candidatus Brocadia sp.]MBL1169237.1 transketolase [Candidatus Brocadia sp. AMX1]NOG42968.1 transketolase [Planctomycetota bacterium]GIK12200.1 MAG: transketolase [Candidatus Brocadia sinica]KAA0242457.1 MAG: transketolase [Candidatus Brocadia sp. AMX2]